MGRRFDDKETQHHIKSLSYKVVKAENGDAWIQTSDSKINLYIFSIIFD
jgi:molecular chaperone DnaK